MTGLRWGWLAAAALLGLWVLAAYNRVVALRGAVATAWQQLDALIQSRQHAIGSLVDATEPSLADEQATFDALVEAQVPVATAAGVVRRRPTSEEPVAALAKSEIALGAALARVVALVENDPVLRQDPAVGAQLAELATPASREQFARKAFNETAATYNAAIAQFPTRLLTRVSGFERAGGL